MSAAEPAVVTAHHCTVPGCPWHVYASRGYAAPRVDRHMSAEHPEVAG